jgi:hypothetical protein
VAFLSKPFECDDLVAAIRRALSGQPAAAASGATV